MSATYYETLIMQNKPNSTWIHDKKRATDLLQDRNHWRRTLLKKVDDHQCVSIWRQCTAWCIADVSTLHATKLQTTSLFSRT